MLTDMEKPIETLRNVETQYYDDVNIPTRTFMNKTFLLNHISVHC